MKVENKIQVKTKPRKTCKGCLNPVSPQELFELEKVKSIALNMINARNPKIKDMWEKELKELLDPPISVVTNVNVIDSQHLQPVAEESKADLINNEFRFKIKGSEVLHSWSPINDHSGVVRGVKENPQVLPYWTKDNCLAMLKAKEWIPV